MELTPAATHIRPRPHRPVLDLEIIVMTTHRFLRRLVSALAVGLVLSASLAGVADARRGGGFGSRG